MHDESVLAPSTALWNEAADFTLFGYPVHWDSVIHVLVAFGLVFFAVFYLAQGSRSIRKLSVRSAWPRMLRAMLEQELDREIGYRQTPGVRKEDENTLICYVSRTEETEVIRLIREMDEHAVITVESSGLPSRARGGRG
ncbi:DUF2179 domain-containing protein [Gorillibacterium timonense]|uniref:DUF2179 domain-containing protein n=1 Tax=Gorillibacterium timonense TaxID=1689269 RepID=UPI00071E3B4B|nr:DUF2179 domain-containing protein [Gorillibacterium timonense]